MNRTDAYIYPGHVGRSEACEKIVDKKHQVWCEDMPRGQEHLSCLEDEYTDKVAFILGMKLSSQCDTATRVLFMINLYEASGSFPDYKWGQQHQQFFATLHDTIVKNILHSTKVPSGLSLKTFVNVSRAFWQANPNDPMRVLIVGAGCCKCQHP